MKRLGFGLLCIILLITPCGCWDARYLQESRLVFIAGFDRLPEGKLLTTAVIREEQVSTAGVEPIGTIVMASGRTPRDTRDSVNRRLNDRFDPSQMQTLVLGEPLAREDIYPILDVFYRDPKSPLDAQLAVVKGTAKELLLTKKVGDTRIGEYVREMIASTEEDTIVPKENIQSVCPLMFDPGHDFALPYLSVKKGPTEEAGIDNEIDVSVEGIAMFHGHHMTGSLNSDESRLFMLMSGKRYKTARINIQINPGNIANTASFLSVSVEKVRRTWDVQPQRDGSIQVDLNLTLYVTVIEYPKDKLANETVRSRLNKKISQSLTHQATQTVKKMQQATFDGFGIGREIMAHHPEHWQGTKWWTTTYPRITITPRVQVRIVGHGIIN
jgi:Ger(x)C family germination protein